MSRSAPAATSLFLAGSSTMSSPTTSGSRTTSSPTPTPRPSSATTTSMPRTTAASSPATTRNRARTTTPAGPTPVRRKRRKRTHRPIPATGWRARVRPSTGRLATRPCRTRDRCFRFSSATTPAIRPRWWSGFAGHLSRSFFRWQRSWPRTPGATEPARSATRSAGRSRVMARRSSARRASCSCSSATSDGRAAASWRCAATPQSRDRPTCQLSSTCCRATCRTRRPSRATTHLNATCGSRRSGAATGRTCRSSWCRCSRPGTGTPPPPRTNLATSGFPS